MLLCCNAGYDGVPARAAERDRRRRRDDRARFRCVAHRDGAGTLAGRGSPVGVRRRRASSSLPRARCCRAGLCHGGRRDRPWLPRPTRGFAWLRDDRAHGSIRCILRVARCKSASGLSSRPCGVSASYLVVDSDLEIPPYQQVVEQIRAAIEREELLPDAPLPTVRQLADDLGIAPNTVARAYGELQSAGWLVGDGRRGTRVAGQLPLNRRMRMRNLREAAEKFVGSLRHRGFTSEEIALELARLAGSREGS
ncbi:MAG: GntR family transcriptional regulator [Candidatus Eremiobacteraeota bacterium]|nr:GntR family transcriptional regulator [Candidatus Eremiobacteraeota bacterium]